MKVKILLIAFLSIVYLQANAQKSNDEVTLVVSATASTEDEAIKTALRSAIEQTYGTFVSANTTLLNDELVKDEIVTISSGNIKKYSKIEAIKNANGQISVTLRATISISKLVSYAKSKGASAELAGGALAMNFKMYELNTNAELKALENLVEYMINNLHYAFDRKLEISDPEAIVQMPRADENAIEYINACEDSTFSIWDCYQLTMHISYQHNKNTEAFFTYIRNTLESISFSDEEYNSIKKLGVNRTEVRFPFTKKSYYLRNDPETLNEVGRVLMKVLDIAFGDFYVVDNLGGRSHVTYEYDINKTYLLGQGEYWKCESGVLSPYFYMVNNAYSYGKVVGADGFAIYEMSPSFNFELTCFIPKDKIAQYSSFTIE